MTVGADPWAAVCPAPVGFSGAAGRRDVVTFAPGGGEKRKTLAEGFAKLTEVKAVSNAGRPVAPAACTCTRSGTLVFASTAIRTSPTSERASLDASTNS